MATEMSERGTEGKAFESPHRGRIHKTSVLLLWFAGFELAGTVFMFANEGPDKYNIDFGHLQPENPRGGH